MLPYLPKELWIKIYTYKKNFEKRDAAYKIVSFIENWVYYYVYRSPYGLNITDMLSVYRGHNYIHYLLAKPGIRWEFKHKNGMWGLILNLNPSDIDNILDELNIDINNGIYNLYTDNLYIDDALVSAPC
tara:strand:- start:771 stop:1157 length:387 start_codon:yes stop_codon:yes gene_type:complete